MCDAQNEESVHDFLSGEGWAVLQVEEADGLCLTVGRAKRRMQNCMVCGQALDYLTAAVKVTCTYCGRIEAGYVICPADHYVCGRCHDKGLSEFVCDFVRTTDLRDPLAIAQAMMAHPALPMLSCAHAPIAAAALLAALRNSGRVQVPDEALREAIIRTERQAISGYCGLTGVCGIPVAIGAAFSVLLGGRCGVDEPTARTMKAVSLAVDAVAGAMGPSCCRKFVGVALEASTGPAREYFEVDLPLQRESLVCLAGSRHPHGCHRERCAYFSTNPPEVGTSGQPADEESIVF